jgi:hypothetical protein
MEPLVEKRSASSGLIETSLSVCAGLSGEV